MTRTGRHPVNVTYLLSPYDVDTFRREVWERGVLHVSRNDGDYFAALRENLSLDHVIWLTCQEWGDVSLARVERDSAGDDFVSRPPDFQRIRDAFRAGYTIVVNNLERKDVGVAELCRQVEREWFFNASVNLYATPPNTQGLGYHYDDEDVFILQIEGSKVWRVYETETTLPLGTSMYQSPACDSSPYAEYKVQPGDVLYIPRGFVHEARALDEISVHLTLTISVIRWASLLHQLVDVNALDNLELRRAVPIELLACGVTEADLARLRCLATELVAKGSVFTAVEELREGLLAAKSRVPRGDTVLSYRDLEEVRPNSAVAIAPDQVFFLVEFDDALHLKCIGASIELSQELGQTIRYICSARAFVVDELPGDLSGTEKIGLVRNLISCGFLALDSAADGRDEDRQ